MSTRSDVGIALKTGILEKLSVETIEFLENAFDKHEHEEGVFFHTEGIKWSTDQVIYRALSACPYEDYLIVEACHDYPEASENQGAWTDNPWGACQETSTRVTFTPTQEI